MKKLLFVLAVPFLFACASPPATLGLVGATAGAVHGLSQNSVKKAAFESALGFGIGTATGVVMEKTVKAGVAEGGRKILKAIPSP